MITINDKEIKKEIRRLRGVANKATDAGLKKVLKPAQEVLKNLTPVESSILKRGVGVKNVPQRDKSKYGLDRSTRAVKLGFIKNTKDARLRKIEKKITLPALASILSYGAQKHTISAKSKKSLKYGALYSKSIDHPGVRGSGFLQKFYSKVDSGSLILFYAGIEEYMKKHAA